MNSYKTTDVVIKFFKVNFISMLSFFLGGVLVLCFVKTDKLSDSISALANVVMAFAAIMGLVFAKKWKRDATKDKVIDRCVKILSVHLLDIREAFVPAVHVKVSEAWFTSFTKKDAIKYKDVFSLKKIASSYVAIIKRESELYTELVSDLEYLKLLSWYVKEEHNEVIEKIKTSMKDIVAKDQELLALINIVFGMWGINVYDDDTSKGHTDFVYNISKDSRVESAVQLIPQMIREREDLNTLIESLLSKQLNVFSFIEQIEH
ncbi:hypothetical protein [Enterobacter bugandensis]|uniref:hypothetical protein n=1 Tax=Enterobacter bugandensis TaxID=881260 RepID=UPI002003806B|nr:hypothetical protein [Enterobacter bugandensis]MCK7131750.1 hypothetical protein [Enterobacter bugandensis]